MPTSARESNSRNMGLQALRGLAAGSVVIYHAAHYTNARLNAPWLEDIFNGNFGYYGVLVFFVLSGFLMESSVRRYDARTFLLHRIARLYPTYWAIYLCVFLAQAIRLHSFESIPWESLSLLPLGPRNVPLGVEWTMVYEVFFYALCTLLCFRRRWFPWVALIWLAIVLVAVFQYAQYGTEMQPTIWQIPFSLWNVGFICGALAGVANRLRRLPSTEQLWLIGLALILVGFAAGVAYRMFFAGPGIACIVIALSRKPASDATNPSRSLRTLSLLGEYSYGMYLAHVMSIGIVLQFIPVSADPLHIYVAMLGVGLTTGIAAGMLDVALYRRLKTWIDSRFASADRAVPNVTAPSGRMSGRDALPVHCDIPRA